jgi:hypothetical protein
MSVSEIIPVQKKICHWPLKYYHRYLRAIKVLIMSSGRIKIKQGVSDLKTIICLMSRSMVSGSIVLRKNSNKKSQLYLGNPNSTIHNPYIPTNQEKH